MDIQIKIDSRSKGKDGLFPIILYMRHRNVVRINTGYKARADFNGSLDNTYKDYKVINKSIEGKRAFAVSEATRLEMTGELFRMTDSDLRDRMNEVVPGKVVHRKENLLSDAIDGFIKTKSNAGTIGLYKLTYRKVISFDSDATLEEVNQKWLKRFVDSFGEECTNNYISIHLRNIRAVFNYAMDEGMTTNYPFRKFPIKAEETTKRSLTVHQIRHLFRYPVDGFQRRYLDMFRLIFYLIGINVSDLHDLKKENLQNGRIVYRRHKTGHLYSIKVEPEAMRIINRYKGGDHLISFMDEWNNVNDFSHTLNRQLQRIGKVDVGKKGKKTVTAAFPGLTTYWARHTWATIASELDIPIETIGLALGHKVGSSVTNIYIRYNPAKIDDANRKVIDYVSHTFSVKSKILSLIKSVRKV